MIFFDTRKVLAFKVWFTSEHGENYLKYFISLSQKDTKPTSTFITESTDSGFLLFSKNHFPGLFPDIFSDLAGMTDREHDIR